jgi:hypothetical protein
MDSSEIIKFNFYFLIKLEYFSSINKTSFCFLNLLISQIIKKCNIVFFSAFKDETFLINFFFFNFFFLV